MADTENSGGGQQAGQQDSPRLDGNLGQNGVVLANQYELVRTILSLVPMRDLLACGRVCRLWREVQLLTMRHRRRYDASCFYWAGKAAADVSFYSAHPLFQSPHHREMWAELERHTATMPSRPRVAVVFGAGDTELSVRDRSPGTEPEDHMERSWLVDKEGIMARLPPGCLAIGTTSRGIVGTPKPGSTVELENLYDEPNLLRPAVSVLMIPERPGARILPFHLAENSLDTLVTEVKRELGSGLARGGEAALQAELLARAVPGLTHQDTIKAVVLLSNGLDLPFSMHLIQGAAARAGQAGLAIGGAVGDLCWASVKDTSTLALMRELFYFNYQSVPVAENSYMATSGFVIAGEGVQAASVLLPRKVRSEKRVMAELQKLKDSGICQENSFAFMFACCGRGENHYRGRAGLEAACFAKLFPNTPLAGLFGNGEIGVSHVPQQGVPGSKAEAAPASRLQPGQFLHSFTTIFLMVSLGRC